MGLDLEYPLSALRGAEYNPRRITPEALADLEKSVRTFGVAKPVIACADGTIIAGHQRTKALLAIGSIDTVPVYLIDKAIGKSDERFFNLLHNGSDLEVDGDVDLWVAPDTNPGYGYVRPNEIVQPPVVPGAPIRQMICHLIARFGNWGGAVATTSGRVIAGGQYLVSCKSLRVRCLVYRIPDYLEEQAMRLFRRDYGEYDIGTDAVNPWIQSFAQLRRTRTRGKSGSLTFQSKQYQKWVIPALNADPHLRMLDFGCGQGDYVERLRSEGRNVWGMEFYPRAGNDIDMNMVQIMADALFAEIRAHGLFDIVLCDYVVNSVVSHEVVRDIFTCVNAFCKPGGRISIAGRTLETFAHVRKTGKSTGKATPQIPTCMPDGRQILERWGQWFLQLYHTWDQVDELVRSLLVQPRDNYKTHKSTGLWGVWCTKNRDLPEADVIASLRREFDLPHPDGRSVGRADDAVAAWLAARAIGA